MQETAIDKYFFVPKMYLKNIVSSSIDGGIHSFIWKGEPGIGKSHMTMQTLEEMGMRRKVDYAVLSGHTTPLELYTFLYHNRDKVVVLDDIPNVFDNETSYHILLSALWTVTGERMLYYLSSTDRLKVPKEFEFKGKVIFLTNKMPLDSDSLRSRCLFYDMNLTFWQKMEIMQQIAQNIGISEEVMKFIRSNSDETTKDFNIRTLVKINSLFLQNNGSWKRLALEQLETDETLRLIKRICELYEKTSEQVTVFHEKTGMSRASFFRLKEKLRKSNISKEIYVKDLDYE